MIHEKVLLCSLPGRTRDDAVRRLSKAGLAFFTAESVVDGLQVMKREGTTVVLVGGVSTAAIVDACAQFRALESGRSLVVVAVVGEARDATTVLEAGADDFCVEPLEGDAIDGRILAARRRALGITSRWHADQERARFVELSPLLLLCLAGRDGHLAAVSPGWTSLLGWSSTELQSRPWTDFVHEDDRATTLAALTHAGAGHAVIGFTNRFRRQDGAYRVLDWRIASWPEREVVYAVVTDATDASAARAVLHAVSENLATTLNSIGDGVVSVDLSCAVTHMNPVAVRLTGWTLAEAKGRPAAEVLRFIEGDTRVAAESPLARALHDGGSAPLPDNCLLVRRDGTEIPVADSCAPIKSECALVSGAVLVFRDLTAQRSAAAEQGKLRQQLVFADRMASVGTLAAGVAHEINNPLTYVGANVDMALEGVRGLRALTPSVVLADLEETLAEARTGIDRVAKIARGLKAFSRLDEERTGVVDLVHVFDLAVTMAFNEVHPRARLVREYAPVPAIVADDTRLTQVFINLLVNAAHSFPEGSNDANEIRVVTRTDEGGHAVAEVHDTGAGIPAAVLDHVFEPFFTTKPAGVGTGLGLAISQAIVTAIGGKIVVESEPGRGTVVRVTFPPTLVGKALPAAEMPRSSVVPARRGTVLVVDDEPSVGHAISRVLRRHLLTVVTSATAALAVLETGMEFDVILSDIMMPVMSGMDLYRTLGKINPKMASRMVFVSAGAFTAEAIRFLEEVPNERIEKPFSSDELRELVQKFVR